MPSGTPKPGETKPNFRLITFAAQLLPGMERVMIELLLVLEEHDPSFSPNVEELFEQYSDMVYRIAFVQMKAASDADDVFQEVFLRLVRHAHKLRSQEHAKAWLIRCTINCCNSMHTSSWRKKTVELEEFSGVLEGLDHRHLELLEAVKGLSPDHRTVIHLFYYEGYQSQEIAQMLEINENTVKSRLRRARQELRAVWGEEEDGFGG